MKKILFLFIILLAVACSKFGSDKDRFIDTYKDILITRVKYQDSNQVKKEISKIYSKNNYNSVSFRNDYFKYAQNPKEFLIMLDSAKSRARREIMVLNKSKFKLRDKE